MTAEREESSEDRNERINREHLRQNTLILIAMVTREYHWEHANEAQIITRDANGTSAIRFRRIPQGKGEYEVRTLNVRQPEFQIEAHASTHPNELPDVTYKSGEDKLKGMEAIIKANEVLRPILPSHKPN